MSIILLTDVLELRARQRRELVYYNGRKAELEYKLSTLRRELQLTDKILSMITSEHKNELSLGSNLPTRPEDPGAAD